MSLKELGVSQSTQKVSIKTAVDGIVAPRLEEIFQMIAEKIKESGFGGATPAGIVLTGGGAQTIRIKYNCQHCLGLPVRIASPKEVGGIVDELLTPTFASSIGLILYGIDQKRTKDTLPHRMFDLGKLKGKLPIKGAFQRVGEILKPLLP
jgi:Actin-like ATPase involved in cell division